MKKMLAGAVIAAAGTFGFAEAASAAPEIYCGGKGGLTTCAAVDMFWDEGTGSLTVHMWNYTGVSGLGTNDGTVFTAFGLIHSGQYSFTDAQLFDATGSQVTQWAYQASGGNYASVALNPSIDGPGSTYGIASPCTLTLTSNPIFTDTPCAGGLPSSGHVTFRFYSDTEVNPADIQWAFRGQSVNDGSDPFNRNGSLICATDPNGSTAGDLQLCEIVGGGGGPQVVPEPITMVLLGSGLLGVGGAAARRRKEDEVEGEEA
jgi:hypothetical protein